MRYAIRDRLRSRKPALIVFVMVFLWGGRGYKIKRNIMIADYDQGGLKMVDVPLFAKSLKSAWIKKILRPR